MFNCLDFSLSSKIQITSKIIAVLAIITPATGISQGKYEGVGRVATANELAAWDIDVRPDFKGLPKGMGSVSQGEKVWEIQCASCHGSFGENNSVFSALVGYTTKKDVETGRVASLMPEAATPTRTTMMKVSQLSTLWDYINRAMPWTAPKSLKPNEVYAVTAYLLNIANVVPDDFTLSDKNMAETQKKLPNRHGMTTAHAMWPGKELGGKAKPDVQGANCMTNCVADAKVASFLPEHARNAHGNLAEQMRAFGSSVGADTTKPAVGLGADVKKGVIATAIVTTKVPEKAVTVAVSEPLKSTDVSGILSKNACSACHGIDNKIVGPAFKDIAAKQGSKADAVGYLTAKIKSGGSGVYGAIPMPAQSLSDADAKKVALWISQGAMK
jgi:S-disulfanyl-L-cysteine oxidoreductase SoxD